MGMCHKNRHIVKRPEGVPFDPARLSGQARLLLPSARTHLAPMPTLGESSTRRVLSSQISQRLAWRKSDRVGHQDRELLRLHPVHAAHRQPEAVPEEPEQHRQNADDLASVQHVAIKHLSGQKIRFRCRNPHIHQTRTTTHDQLRHPCFGDHSRLV